ncbi:MAG: S9 family peptidase [Bacteroidetes bacterium]|nr:S9 family peptidase [Bacteroidota bacterium]
MLKKFIALMITVTALTAAHAQNEKIAIGKERPKYPLTKKEDIVEDHFGTKVADPYRWLENDTTAETADWVKEQNTVTFDYLSKIPFRNKLKSRITDLINYPKFGSPWRAGEYYFYSKNDGLQNQSVMYYQKGIDAEPVEFLNPNTMSKDGTVTAGMAGFNKKKDKVTVSVQRSGSDWQELYVMDVATKTKLKDSIAWAKFTGATWQGDGFYYCRYDAPVKGKEFSNKNEYHKIYYHKLGDDQSKDQLIYEDKNNPQRYYGMGITEDERFLLLSISQGTDNFDMWYKDTKDASQKDFKPLFTGFNQKSNVVDNDGDMLIVQTNVDASRYKIVLVDPKNPGKENWKTLVPETKDVIDGVGTAGKKLFITYLKDGCNKVFQYDYKGKLEREIQLPGLGSAGGFGGNFDDKEIFYTYTSFIYPPTIFRYDIASGKSEVFRKSELKFNPEEYTSEQLFAKSKDGTMVPLFVTYKKGLNRDGMNPTLLYAYGGFSVSLGPSFSASRMAFLEQGGVYAMALLRGGGEYGEEWHKAGMLKNKQNVFDDFISCAEHLISNKFTSPSKLAIQGGSNGGLLIGACTNQRPDLFAVAIPQVGVMDMLRYHKFTVGWGWIDEYGNPDSASYFKYIYDYSPLHNIKTGASYPAVMITTADHDDRVVPAHSFKYAATLQDTYKGSNPTLIRIDVKAGHGGGKPLSKTIEEITDIYSFILYNTNSTVK